jgi:hypothetical protein
MAKHAQGEALAQEAELMRKLGLQLAELQEMGLAELRAKHLELFGEAAKSKNLPFLRKRLAFRLQERVEGGLSPAAKAQIEELAPATLPEAAKRLRTQCEIPPRMPAAMVRDPRLPASGTVLAREHKGFAHEVEVLEQGFRYRGRDYRSLSAIAKEIAGTPWNGFTFFGLGKERADGQA